MPAWLEKLLKKFRLKSSKHGYTCDSCGAELFEYPLHRLCNRCEGQLTRPYTHVCEKCGRQTYTQGVCLDCKSALPTFTRGFAPFVYQGNVAALVNRLKNGEPHLGWYFGEQMAEYFLAQSPNLKAESPLLIIPVPMTDRAHRKRGYNQAERLAESIEERFTQRSVSAQLRADILQKKKETASQKKMSLQERRKNVEGAYRVIERKACKDKTVLLIDDICTTGATASECAERLLKAGAKAVYFLAIAALPESKA